MQRCFTDSNKLSKNKYFLHNIATSYYNNERLTNYWELKERIPNYFYIGIANFNWNNIFCSVCNNEYGCINLLYYKDNKIRQTSEYLYQLKTQNQHQMLGMWGSNQAKSFTPEPVLEQFKKDYCIGCFMASHNQLFSADDRMHSNKKKEKRMNQPKKQIHSSLFAHWVKN